MLTHLSRVIARYALHARLLLLLTMLVTMLPAKSTYAQGPNQIFLPLAASDDIPRLDGSLIIPGEYLIEFREPQGLDPAGNQPAAISVADQANSLLDVYGGELTHLYETAIQGYAVRNLSEEAATALAEHPLVASITPNYLIQVEPLGWTEFEEYPLPETEAASVAPDADQSGATWGLDRIDQRDLPLNNNFRYHATGSGVHAYIIDSGLKTTFIQYRRVGGIIRVPYFVTHPQFAGRVGNGINYVNDNNGTSDCHGHGTHVAGTVGGATWGVAKGVTIHPVRVLNCQNSGSRNDIVAGINWVARNHIKPAVANISIGFPAGDTVVDNAVNGLIRAGVAAIVSAGNRGVNACTQSPARVRDAITVGSVANNDRRAAGTNFGNCIDIFAPGVDIRSASHTSHTAGVLKTGTSMATPHVTGAVAQYLQIRRNATPAEIRILLVDSSSRNTLTSLGTGSPNRMLFTQVFHLADIYEGDGTRGSAKAIDINNSLQYHSIHAVNEVDYMKFTLVAGRRYRIYTTALANGADTVLRLYDSNGTLLRTNDDGGGGLASQIIWTAPASRVYYIRVNNYRATRYHGYQVAIAPYTAAAVSAAEAVISADAGAVQVVALTTLQPTAPLPVEEDGQEPLEDSTVAGDVKYEARLHFANGLPPFAEVTLFGETLPVRLDEDGVTLWVTLPSNIPAAPLTLIVNDGAGFVAGVEVTLPLPAVPEYAVVATGVSPAVIFDDVTVAEAVSVPDTSDPFAEVPDTQSSAPSEAEVNANAVQLFDQDKPMVAIEVTDPVVDLTDVSLEATLYGESLPVELEAGTNRLWITLPVGLAPGVHTVLLRNDHGSLGTVAVTVNE